MHFEINIALNGAHFFATHARSVESEYVLGKVLPVLRKKFPKSEGYSITVSHIRTSGEVLTDEKLALICAG